MHDTNLLAKLFSSSLKNEALNWYFQLLENRIYSYEDLIHIFFHNYGYNITEKCILKAYAKLNNFLINP